jgi:hypothetical protein
MVMVLLVSSTCAERPETEAGVFFPTWSADGTRPTGVVQGTLVERDGCLFLLSSGKETLIVWDDEYAFAGGSLLGPSGDPIVRFGWTLHGGGGYYGRAHAEDVSGTSIPDRCVPDQAEGFALIYGVEAGPFE